MTCIIENFNPIQTKEIEMTKREVVVLSGVRTAIGTYGGTLKDQPRNWERRWSGRR